MDKGFHALPFADRGDGLAFRFDPGLSRRRCVGGLLLDDGAYPCALADGGDFLGFRFDSRRRRGGRSRCRGAWDIIITMIMIIIIIIALGF